MIKYIPVYRCTDCKEVLSNNQVMYSDGVCPKCGNIAAGTSVDHIKSSEKIETKSLSDKLFGWLR